MAVADHAWTVTLVEPVAGAGRVLQATDEEGRVWVFMARSPAEGDAAGHTTLIADYDGDGQPDQVRVTPGRHDSAVMMAYLASGAVHRVADLPRGAEVLLAQRGRQWRNADGSVLVVPPGRDAVLVSTEPAPGRSDVVVYLYENGRWRAWEYAPD